MIRVRSLSKRYGEHPALHDVDLDLPAGTVYGLVGPNGAGKTTLLSILAGLRRPTAGDVEIAASPTRRAVLPDTPRFDKWLTAREVVDLAAALTGQDRAGAATDVLARAGLADAADRRVGGFSRGMLQRLGIAAAIVGDPELLLLDEPAAALDPAGRREVLDLVDRIRGSATVIFSSHILADVQAVSDRVGILDRGVLRYEGRIDELLAGVAGTTYLVRLREAGQGVARVLGEQNWVTEVEVDGSHTLRIRVKSLAEAERNLVPVLAATGAAVVSVEPEPVTLERAFLEMTS